MGGVIKARPKVTAYETNRDFIHWKDISQTRVYLHHLLHPAKLDLQRERYPNLLLIDSKDRISPMSDKPIEPTEDDAQDIWRTWLEVHRDKKRKASPLSLQRLKIINAAIISYGKDNCLKAIIGCKNSEWHMGGNPTGKKYNTIELILRVSSRPEEQARNERRVKNLVKLADKKDDGGV